MHSSTDNSEFRSYSDADELTDELFKSLRSKNQENLETSMKGSNFIFDSVQLMYYKIFDSVPLMYYKIFDSVQSIYS